MHFHLSELTHALQSWTHSDDSYFIHFFLPSADQTMESIHNSWKFICKLQVISLCHQQVQRLKLDFYPGNSTINDSGLYQNFLFIL